MGRNEWTTPTLGVSGVLFALWCVAAGAAGPGSPAALALDPGGAASIGRWWGAALLAAATLAALGGPVDRARAWAPALLLAGEAGELHIRAAELLAGWTGARGWLCEIKIGVAALVGACVLLALLRRRHSSCYVGLAALVALGGAVSLLLEAGQLAVAGPARVWLSAGEEWIELAVYSAMTSVYLAVSDISSHIGTRCLSTGSQWSVGQRCAAT